MTDIFISYRRTYRDQVERLRSALIDVGGFASDQIFRDESSLRAGDPWSKYIELSIQRAKVVMVVVGPGWRDGSAGNGWVQNEIDWARQYDRQLLPVILEGADETAVSKIIGDRGSQWAKVSTDPTTREVRDLAEALQRLEVAPRRRVDAWQLVRSRAQSPLHTQVTEVKRQLETGERFERMHTPVDSIVVHGPPGSGRTRALHELLTAASEHAATAMHQPTAMTNFDSPCPVLLDWLPQLLAAESGPSDGATIADAVVRECPSQLHALRHLVPAHVVVGALPLERQLEFESMAEDGGAELDLVEAAVDVLFTAAEVVPIAVAIDDFHLASPSCRLLIERLQRRSAAWRRRPSSGASPRIVVIGVDDDPTDGVVDAGQRWTRGEHADSVDADVGNPSELVESVIASGEPKLAAWFEDARTLHDVRVILDHLFRESLIDYDRSGQVWRSTPELSDTVPLSCEQIRDLVIDRAVPVVYQSVLERAAALGRVFHLDVAAGDLDPEALGDTGELDPGGLLLDRSASGDGRWYAFKSAAWCRHLLRRRRPQPEDIAALAQAMEDQITGVSNHFHHWLRVGALWKRADQPGRAAVAHVRAARSALSWSSHAAFEAYCEAAKEFQANSWRSDGPDRVRERLRAAFCHYRTAQVELMRLSAVAHDEVSRSDSFETAGRELASARRLLESIVGRIRTMSAAEPVDIDQAVIERRDPALEDEEQLDTMRRTLLAHVLALEASMTLDLDGPDAHRSTEWPTALDDESLGRCEQDFHDALKHAADGRPGRARRFVVMQASAGLADLHVRLARRHQRAPADGDHRACHPGGGPTATDAAFLRLRAEALFHSARARMIETHFDDDLSHVAHPAEAFVVERIRERLVRTRRELRHLGLGHIAACLDGSDPRTHRFVELDLDSRWRLVRDWTDGLSGFCRHFDDSGRVRHDRRVAELAHEIAERAGLDDEVAADAAVAATTHDLFRFVEPTRLVAIVREHGVELTGDEWNNPLLLHGVVAVLWLRHDVGLHLELGPRRFRDLALALQYHTIGQIEPGPVSLVLHVADEIDRRGDRDMLRSIADRGSLEHTYRQVFEDRAAAITEQGRRLVARAEVNTDRVGSQVSPDDIPPDARADGSSRRGLLERAIELV